MKELHSLGNRFIKSAGFVGKTFYMTAQEVMLILLNVLKGGRMGND